MKTESTVKLTVPQGVACADGLGGWTKTPPTKPGHYWITFGDNLRMTVLEVEMWHGEMQCYYHNDWRPLKDANYWKEVVWWPVMIQPPNEKSDTTAGWNAGVERLKRRREYWLTCKEDAMRRGNLCAAGGFDCRAAGLNDALQIIAALEEEKHSNAPHEARRGEDSK